MSPSLVTGHHTSTGKTAVVSKTFWKAANRTEKNFNTVNSARGLNYSAKFLSLLITERKNSSKVHMALQK